jgi:Domain of Unknown Function (DUF350)/Glutathionylspermidine synthase preATP-grasp
MILQSLTGLPAFLAYFCTAFVIVIVYLIIYTRITPHDEFALLRDNVPGAAIALGLSLVGFALPVASAIAHAENLIDWRQLADQCGFVFRSPNGEPYLDETAYYAFSLKEVEEDLEAPTAVLHAMC